jgi:predicted NAD-dependent protein-ADP-ribosyltransferase YbiA (DUF1768 family)
MFGSTYILQDTAQEILATSEPRKQRALGRTVKGFEEEVWDARELFARLMRCMTFWMVY